MPDPADPHDQHEHDETCGEGCNHEHSSEEGEELAPGETVVQDLNDEERAWLEEQREMLVSAVQELDLGLPEEDQITLLDAAQALVTWWNAAPEGERPAAGSIVAVAGVALGDCLNQYLGMEWSIIHDEDGTDIGMHEPEGTVLMYPTHSVAHRLRDASPGMMQELFDGLCEAFEEHSKAAGDDSQPDDAEEDKA